MKAILLIPVLLVAVSGLTITQLSNGTTVRAYFGQTASVEDDETNMRVFQLYVPANTLNVSVVSSPVAYNATTAACSAGPDVLFAGGSGVPCGVAEGQYSGTFIVPCSSYFQADEVFTYTIDASFAIGEMDDLQWGRTWYFGIRKNLANHEGEACAYDFTVTLDNCGTGASDIGGNCQSPTPMLSNGSPVSFTIEDTSVYYVTTLSENTDIVNITLSLPAQGFGAIYAQYGYIVDHQNFFCGTGFDGSNNTEVTLICYSNLAGPFYITVADESGVMNSYTMRVVTASCPAGFTGFQCQAPTVAWNSDITSGTLGAYSSEAEGQQPCNNYYIDFPANSTTALNITVGTSDMNNPNGVVIYRKDIWPFDADQSDGTDQGRAWDYDSDKEGFEAGEAATLYLTAEDLYVGGRYWIAVCNENSEAGLDYTFGSSSTSTGVITSSSGSSTSGASTSGSKTTSVSGASTGTSSASSTSATTGSSTKTTSVSGASTAAVSTAKSGASSFVVATFLVLAAVLVSVC